MKRKKYLNGITFFVATEMYDRMKGISDRQEISVSELIRELIQAYLESRTPNLPANPNKGEEK
jgi:predicted DNA-binding protein